MATAKRQLIPVKDHTGKTIKVECEACFNEEGSHACIRPAHDAYNQPLDLRLLATAINEISGAVQALYKSGLNKRAVVALIADDTKLGKGTINTVLNSLADLQKNYTTPKGTNSRGPM